MGSRETLNVAPRVPMVGFVQSATKRHQPLTLVLLLAALLGGLVLPAVTPAPAAAVPPPGMGTISGLVTNAAGSGVPFCNVNFYDADGLTYRGSASTNSSGSYGKDLAPGAYTVNFLCFSAGAPEWWNDAASPASATVIDLDAGETFTAGAQITPGGAISGVVSGPDGPLAGACVQVLDAEIDGRNVTSRSTSVTGYYNVDRLHAGDYKVRFSQDCYSLYGGATLAPEYFDNQPTRADAATIAVTEGSTFATAHATLEVAGSVSGVVSGAGQGPLSDVCVRAVGADEEELGYGYTSVTGYYLIDGLRAGRDHRIEYQECGGRNWVGEWFDDQPSLASGTPVVPIAGDDVGGTDAELAVGGSISGVVSGPSGPTSGVCVDAYDSDDEFVSSGYTSVTGYYVVPGLQTGGYRIWFGPCNNQPLLGEYYADEPTLATADPVPVTVGVETPNIDAVLARAGTITGDVTTPSGTPISNVCVTVYDASGQYAAFAYTNGAGRYQTGGLEPGGYRVQYQDCFGRGFLSEYAHDRATLGEADVINVPIGVDVEVDESLSVPAGKALISGTVTKDADGTPIQSMCVRITQTNGNWVTQTSSGSDGRWFAVVNPGIYKANAMNCGPNNYVEEWFNDSPSLNTAEIITALEGTDTGNVDFGLAPGSSIFGRVTNANGTGATSCAAAYPASATTDGSPTAIAYIYSYQNGYYEIRGLPAGQYKVRFGGWCSINSLTEWWNDKTTQAAADVVTVAPGAPAVNINGQFSTGASVSGTVTSGGSPLSGACVSLSPSSTIGTYRSATTDPNGNYSFSGVATGSYRLQFGGCGTKNVVAEYYDDELQYLDAQVLSLQDGTTLTGRDADLAVGGIIEGTVTRDGTPLGNVCVNASGPAYGYATTRPDGTYNVIGLATGTYTVSYHGCGQNVVADTHPDPVEVVGGQTTSPVSIDLEEGAIVQGNISSELGFPLPMACANALAAEFGAITSGYADSNGNYSIIGIPAGQYKVQAQACGTGNHVAEYFDDTYSWAEAQVFDLEAGELVTAVDFLLDPGATIQGTVTDAGGNPIDGICVTALNDGEASDGYGSTDEEGNYAVSGLPAGTYRVQFLPCADEPYVAEYWDDAAAFEDADPVTLTSGQIRTGVDATLAAVAPPSRPAVDFSGDGLAEIAVYRPSSQAWFSSGGLVTGWGVADDIAVPADYNGDGITDVAVFRPSDQTWYVQPSDSFPDGLSTQWGVPGDIPVPADYDGDGKDEIAVFRPSDQTWYSQAPGGIATQWGVPGDVPVPADFNGDGKDEVAVFRPSDQTWYSQAPGGIATQWGVSGDIPIPADFDGDGDADVAVYRPSDQTWYSQSSGLATQWGVPGDLAAPDDHDGDGDADVTVYRPSDATWYAQASSGYDGLATQFGTAGDVPLAVPHAIRQLYPTP
jgi:hypothetical protein